MHKVLIVWDARNAPTQLQHFIESFIETCSDYEIDARFIGFTLDNFNGVDRCQYSMRALLNAVHFHKPDTLISFGSESNLLAKLIKPALKVPLICNNLPSELESSYHVRKQIDKATKTFYVHCNWSFTFDKLYRYYIPTRLIGSSLSQVTIIKSDPLGPVLANIVQQHTIDFDYLHLDQEKLQTTNNFDTLIPNAGLILVSSEFDQQQLLAIHAASLGISTLYVGQLNPVKINGKKIDFLKHVSSTTDIELIRHLKSWRKHSQLQRTKQAKLNQHSQSKYIGIIRFLDDLGYERATKTRNLTRIQNIS